jgi:hypothetical protein
MQTANMYIQHLNTYDYSTDHVLHGRGKFFRPEQWTRHRCYLGYYVLLCCWDDVRVLFWVYGALKTGRQLSDSLVFRALQFCRGN